MWRYAKGYKKIFFYLMDVATFNSYALLKKVTGNQMHFTEFRMKLAEQIFENVTLPEYPRRGPESGISPVRLQLHNGLTLSDSSPEIRKNLPGTVWRTKQTRRRLKAGMSAKNVLLLCISLSVLKLFTQGKTCKLSWTSSPTFHT
jgi:hypothetical protein